MYTYQIKKNTLFNLRIKFGLLNRFSIFGITLNLFPIFKHVLIQF